MSPDVLLRLYQREVAYVQVDGAGRPVAGSLKNMALLPGAFNPVHAGHWELAAVAEQLLGRSVVFELSVENVDKPLLTAADVQRRLQQFAGKASIVVTRAPTFVSKARLFPGTVFVVGADTAARIVARRYYEEDETKMIQALHDIRAHAGRFLVAGRVDAAGRFVGLDDLPVPSDFRDLFTAIPRAGFHKDISSTELRRQSQGEP